MSISIGVPLSIPGVGKDHLFNQLGGGYKIITDNDPIDLRYGNDQHVKRQRDINDNKFWNNVEEAIKKETPKIILNRDFYPSSLDMIKQVVKRSGKKDQIRLIGLWFGQNAPKRQFTSSELVRTIHKGGMKHPFDDNQLWYSIHNSCEKNGSCDTPHLVGYLYKEWKPSTILNMADNFDLFDNIIQVATGSAAPNRKILDQIKDEFYTPHHFGSVDDSLRNQILDHPFKTSLPTPQKKVVKYHFQKGGRRIKKQSKVMTHRNRVAAKNAKRVRKIRKLLDPNNGGSNATNEINKHSELLNVTPDELSKDQLQLINSDPVLKNLYINIYRGQFDIITSDSEKEDYENKMQTDTDTDTDTDSDINLVNSPPSTDTEVIQTRGPYVEN